MEFQCILTVLPTIHWSMSSLSTFGAMDTTLSEIKMTSHETLNIRLHTVTKVAWEVWISGTSYQSLVKVDKMAC